MSQVRGRYRSVPPEAYHGDLVEASSPLFGVVWINPERLGGQACFFGTRVPVRTLFDFVCSGASLEEFVKSFPPIRKDEAEEVLRLAEARLLGRERAA